ncbi:phage tail protein [Nitratidesulfovibrio vulgaris]|uniref:Tail fiber protein n=1 Tax=Nitratidesulfovibrio vulgaris (strain DP4) TaxID=391774 RepID=A0A0H3ABQ5_NITV4|nr:phage tail protein [Nitratidesulfovibrio vulgaris]ABM29759.1 hypothetical protein Dvul_2748 [Nitratidesulfovibrio vulgaris DP4]
MSVALTYAGESLIARLQAEGRPLTIDTFVFADVPGVDHTAPVNPGQGLPEGHEVYRFAIPQEYRAFVNPNQVVYSALLGSDIGPFAFNWQGLYCTEHATLVAVATFPRLEKRKYDPATNTQGNNLTRNFMLEFSGAREVTQVTVEAAVWQLDFSVRLKGMDERERLSNRDIYGRAAFLDDGWLLIRTADAYRFEAGRGYVEGIRAALAEPLPAVPTVSPCDVWLDVSMQAEGSDVVTTVSPLFLAPGTASPDYTTAPPHNTRHYCEKVARIEASGTVVDLRPKSRDVLQQTLGVASAGHTHPLITPAQFTSDKQAATTEFVQRALGNVAGIEGYAANTVLGAEDCGKFIFAQGAGLKFTLPLASSVPRGSVIEIYGNGPGVTVARQGSDQLVNGLAGSSTSIAIGGYDSARFVAVSSAWYVLGGSVHLAGTSNMNASMNSNGFQRLPSGLIWQWMHITDAISAGGNRVLMFPFTFPVSVLFAHATARHGQQAGAGALSVVISGLQSVTVYNNGSVAVNGAFLTALGF